ncbi:hypothetical protein NQ317_017053 [Molorchus minor]|uniref:Laminin G domain-containing protein n=1 Tax=Molorchus minor TaxID=1323400 RepID=A0ABQ9K4R6_9CUCU|nr:hypothetical protein NQ317_017053 [Molorchus minor]
MLLNYGESRKNAKIALRICRKGYPKPDYKIFARLKYNLRHNTNAFSIRKGKSVRKRVDDKNSVAEIVYNYEKICRCKFGRIPSFNAMALLPIKCPITSNCSLRSNEWYLTNFAQQMKSLPYVEILIIQYKYLKIYCKCDFWFYKMFSGNVDGDTIKKNEFEVPIIAQWIRINPTRWRDRISMRVQLFGCEYESEKTYRESDNMYFNGTSLLKVDLLREPIAALRENIRFRLKTTSPNGLILYSKGTQGDYVALQIQENRMLLNIDLGSGIVTSLSVGSLLDDNIWHDVIVVVVQDKIKGEFQKLNLNRAG